MIAKLERLEPAGATVNPVRLWLRLEALAIFCFSALLLSISPIPSASPMLGFLTMAAIFFAPNLAIAGYLAGPRAGGVLYNAAHTYLAPLLLAAASLKFAKYEWMPYAFGWIAHIAMDRFLGYGLRYPAGFHLTHLGLAGKAAKGSQASRQQ